jgi:hypothetical protein
MYTEFMFGAGINLGLGIGVGLVVIYLIFVNWQILLTLFFILLGLVFVVYVGRLILTLLSLSSAPDTPESTSETSSNKPIVEPDNSIKKEYTVCECGYPIKYPPDTICKQCNTNVTTLSTLVKKEFNVVKIDELLTCSCGSLVGNKQEFCSNCNSAIEFNF